MTDSDNDPLHTISAAPPQLSAAAAIALLRQHFGIAADVRTLVSERDQNFLVTADDGRRFVLKIAGQAESRAVTEFQIEALLHIELRNRELQLEVEAPRVVRSKDGQSHVEIDIDSVRHIVRVVTYLHGEMLANVELNGPLCQSLGHYLAQLGQLLQGFRHQGEAQTLLWDMKRAPQLRNLLEHIPDARIRAVAERTLQDYVDIVEPQLDDLRWQVIHADFHPDNIVIDAEHGRPSGVIDFGDMLRSPLVMDVAIAAAYLRSGDLSLISNFVAGYHAATPLTTQEVSLLYNLIRVRLVATICILYWRKSARGADDAYLQESMSSIGETERFLLELSALGAQRASAEIQLLL